MSTPAFFVAEDHMSRSGSRRTSHLRSSLALVVVASLGVGCSSEGVVDAAAPETEDAAVQAESGLVEPDAGEPDVVESDLVESDLVESLLPNADTVFAEDFNSITSTPFEVTKQWIQDTFLIKIQPDGKAVGAPFVYIEMDSDPSYRHPAMQIMPDPSGNVKRGNVLECFISAGSIAMADGTNPPSGGGWPALTAHPDSGTWTELYTSFDYYRPKINPLTGAEHQLMRVQKGPALSGGSWWASTSPGSFHGRVNLASNRGYPGRVPPGEHLSAYGYLYSQDLYRHAAFPDDGVIGDPSYKDTVHFPFGEWWTHEYYIKVNDQGVSNGIWRQWVKRPGDEKGILVTEKTGIRWSDEYKLGGVWFLFTYGGSNVEEYSAPEDHLIYYDNFIVSKSRITE